MPAARRRMAVGACERWGWEAEGWWATNGSRPASSIHPMADILRAATICAFCSRLGRSRSRPVTLPPGGRFGLSSVGADVYSRAPPNAVKPRRGGMSMRGGGAHSASPGLDRVGRDTTINLKRAVGLGSSGRRGAPGCAALSHSTGRIGSGSARCCHPRRHLEIDLPQ